MLRKRLVEAIADKALYTEDCFAAWPSITKGKDGELALVFSGKRQHHIDPFGEIVLLTSEDEGESWSSPVVVESTPLDNRDPGIIQSRDGVWLISFFSSIAYIDWVDRIRDEYGEESVDSWKGVIDSTSPELIERCCGKYLLRFKQLNSMQALDEHLVDTLVNAPHGPVELDDGRLLMVGVDDRSEVVAIRCVESKDGGGSWDVLSTVAPYQLERGISLHEPHLVDLGQGELLLMLRTNVSELKQQLLYFSYSGDGGVSWSEPQATGIEGVPPHILRCEDDTLVLVYGHRKPPYGIRFVTSEDKGVSWSKPHTLMEFQAEKGDELQLPENMGPEDKSEVYYQVPDFGYPASVQLSNGSIITVYYGPVTDTEGRERTGICALHWSLQ